MPRRNDIQKILIIGSGPIVIGQACEFDYSGTQACKALRDEGYEVVLVNSNPATIMTDPETADRTYIEPITPEMVAKIIERERPDALLPTMGGQTALNTTVALAKNGTLDKFGVELIGAKLPAIEKAEDRAPNWHLSLDYSSRLYTGRDGGRHCLQPGRIRANCPFWSRSQSRFTNSGRKVAAGLERIRARSDARFSR
jgi:hypothetical protein